MTAEIHLCDELLTSEVSDVRAQMQKKFGARKIDNRFVWDNWARWSVVQRLVTKGVPSGGVYSLLDVGPEQGQFMNACAASGCFNRLHAVDIRSYDDLMHLGRWRLRRLDVCDLDYYDDNFDVVTALEIIEHLEDDQLPKAVEQIRRVGRRVVVTVPYKQKRLPSYHKQRFDEERLQHFFPNAELTILRRVRPKGTGVDWIMADERV
jgi:2-polyprenyl-3-methyl-5-hydroxy-6-metoxy-1,4-benzoquinol methylase